MSQPVRIIGSYLSPYVRKVLVVLRPEGHRVRDRSRSCRSSATTASRRVSPLRRIPVLIDDARHALGLDGDLRVPRGTSSRARAPAARRRASARAPAGSRSSPTRAWARCSSGASSTRWRSGRSSGASRPTRPSSSRRCAEDVPAGARLPGDPASGRRLPLRRRVDRRHRRRDVLPQRGVRALPRRRGALAAHGGVRRSRAPARRPSSRCARSRSATLRTPLRAAPRGAGRAGGAPDRRDTSAPPRRGAGVMQI